MTKTFAPLAAIGGTRKTYDAAGAGLAPLPPGSCVDVYVDGAYEGNTCGGRILIPNIPNIPNVASGNRPGRPPAPKPRPGNPQTLPQSPTFKQQYNQCVQNAGTTVKVADALGVWGLGSLAVTAGTSAFTSTMQWIHGTSATNIASTVAQQAPNTAADAGTLANMGEHELFLEGTWATVGKISLWVTAGATAVSGGVRGYCAAKAAF